MSFPFHLVDTEAALSKAIDALDKDAEESGGRFFLDTEFESNKQGTRLCLVQMSAGKDIFLLDAVKLPSLKAVSEILDKDDEWVLHAGNQDVPLLTAAFGVKAPARLFDTQVAFGLVGPEANVSLAYLQFLFEGIRADKGHQADDWLRRPMPESQLKYAASDIRYLPSITDKLMAQAEALGRVEIIFDACQDLLAPTKEPPPPLSLQSFRNAWQLSVRGQAALRYLIVWYNALPPERRRHAPEGKTLLSIAGRSPESVDALSRIKGAGAGFVARDGKEIVNGIKKAVAEANGDHFVPIDPAPYATYQGIQLGAWMSELRAELAVSLKFAPELVLPSRLLRNLEETILVEGTEGLERSLLGWRKTLLLDAARSFCQRRPAPV